MHACHPIEEEWLACLNWREEGRYVLANLDVDATELRLGRRRPRMMFTYMLRSGIYANQVAGMPVIDDGRTWKEDLIMDIQHKMMEVMDGIDRTHAR